VAKRRKRPTRPTKVRRKPRPRAPKRRRPAPAKTPAKKKRPVKAPPKKKRPTKAPPKKKRPVKAPPKKKRPPPKKRPPKKPPPKKRRRPGRFERAAAEALTTPPRQRRGEKLTPKQLFPTVSWRSDPRVKKWIRRFSFDRRFRRLLSQYRAGEAAWFPLPEHTALHMVLSGQHPVTLEAIKEHAVQVFRRSGRAHLRFRALLLYWYPDNPAYRGAMVRVTVSTPEGGSKVVERNLGKLAKSWKPMWTKWMFGSTPDGVARAVEAAFYRENQNGVSPARQAEERVIYFVAYELYTFDNVTPPPTEELAGSPLRAV
jgi:hypothetical protein